MYRTRTDCGNTNVSVTRNIDSGTRTRVVRAVAIEYKNEMRWLRIRRWWRDGRGHGAELISASCTDQQKNENGEHAGQTPHTHRHPNRWTLHVFKTTPEECIILNGSRTERQRVARGWREANLSEGRMRPDRLSNIAERFSPQNNRAACRKPGLSCCPPLLQGTLEQRLRFAIVLQRQQAAWNQHRSAELTAQRQW